MLIKGVPVTIIGWVDELSPVPCWSLLEISIAFWKQLLVTFTAKCIFWMKCIWNCCLWSEEVLIRQTLLYNSKYTQISKTALGVLVCIGFQWLIYLLAMWILYKGSEYSSTCFTSSGFMGILIVKVVHICTTLFNWICYIIKWCGQISLLSLGFCLEVLISQVKLQCR